MSQSVGADVPLDVESDHMRVQPAAEGALPDLRPRNHEEAILAGRALPSARTASRYSGKLFSQMPKVHRPSVAIRPMHASMSFCMRIDR